MDKKELDPRILVKNLEITKLAQQVDNLTSELVDLRERITDGVVDIGYSQALGKDEVNPVDYHLTTLKTQIDYLHRIRTDDNSEKHDELIHDLIKLVRYVKE